MNTQWMIKTRGDPLEAVQGFLKAVWRQSNLDGMLVTLNGTGRPEATACILDNPNQLSQINPFKPLMTMNAARVVPNLLREHPNEHFGVLLRPCEMRALIEMVKRNSFNIDALLTICVDCLATLPADEYQWRAERKGSAANLTREALQFARQGGIMPYRYRSACQMCASSQAQNGDVNIEVLGLPVRQYILVSARDEPTAARLQLNKIADDEAVPALIFQRERLLAKLDERHSRTRDRVISGLADTIPKDVDEVVELLSTCRACRACLNICPICSVDYPRRGDTGRYRRDDVIRWLTSCVGCGMCEQVCPDHPPLSIIFSRIREQLTETVDYDPGRSFAPLPVPLRKPCSGADRYKKGSF